MKDSGVIRSHQWLVSLLQRLLDIGIIFGCLSLVTLLHASAISITDRGYLLAGILASGCFYMVASHLRLYRSYRSASLKEPIQLVIQAWFFSVAVLFALSFALKSTAYFSRIALTLWIILTPVCFVASRFLVREVLIRLRVNGRNTRKIVLAGSGEQAHQFSQEISNNPWMGYDLVGFYDDGVHKEPPLAHLGNLDSLVDLAKANQFDAIYIALPMNDSDRIRKLVKALSDCSIPVFYLPDLFTSHLMGGKITRVGNLTSVSIYNNTYDESGALLKRIEDVLLSTLILALVAPLMLLIALLVKLTSKGAVIYKQNRYGLAGEAIQVYKFRTMFFDDEHVEGKSELAGENDSQSIKQATRFDERITPLGRWLRRTSLDELPQFINVLQGGMSIVGPRPHAIVHNEQYRKTIEGYMLRHLVKPGITGWAQINGWRGETDTHEKMEKRIAFDLDYLNNWSVGFDLKIIVLTIFKGFLNKNAY